MTDYDQFTAYARELGCEKQGVVGRLSKSQAEVRVESWALPVTGGFILLHDLQHGEIGIFGFVGPEGAPLAADMQWLRNQIK